MVFVAVTLCFHVESKGGSSLHELVIACMAMALLFVSAALARQARLRRALELLLRRLLERWRCYENHCGDTDADNRADRRDGL